MRIRFDSPTQPAWTLAKQATQAILISDADGTRFTDRGPSVEHFDDAVAGLRWLDRRRRGETWAGFLGYELGRLFEPTARVREEAVDVKTPLYAFGRVDPLVMPPSGRGEVAAVPAAAVSSSFTRAAFEAAVARCIRYIEAGDAFQINLSQRLAVPYAGSGDQLYERLLHTTPATFGGLIELPSASIVSNSPELFLRVTPDRRIETRPIKGTRPRGVGLADELAASAKDAAELNMIVDLMRNDLGRVSETGSVTVASPRTVESHPTVHHAAATVEGQLRDDVGLVELLAATFPPGSVTGAPKVRAMQIIDELEPVGRGVYCGSLCRLDADGSMLMNVAIRTATLVDGVLHVPVGGGIVADSEPAAEYQETLDKARALLDGAGATFAG